MIGTKHMAQRIVNAERGFVASAREQFGLSEAEAKAALAELIKRKLVKIDPVMGDWKLKDGRFWDSGVLKRAAGMQKNPRYPFTTAKSLNATARMLRRIYSAPVKRNPKERVFRIDFKGPDRDAYRPTNAPNLREAKREAASLIRSFPPGWSVVLVKEAYRVNPSFVFEHASLIPAKLRRKNPKLRPHVIERRAQRSAEGHRTHSLRWFSLLPFRGREPLENWAVATQRAAQAERRPGDLYAPSYEDMPRGYKQPKRRNPRRRRTASKRRARR